MAENSSSSSSSTSWNCLGTRMVVVVGANNSSNNSNVASDEALLIVHNEIFPSIDIEDNNNNIGLSKSKSSSKTTTTTTTNNKKKAPPLYSSRLKLVLCNSSNQIYSHIININDSKQVKLISNDDRSKLGDYFLQNSRDHPNIRIEFHYLSTTTIKVDIQQQIATVNNVMKNAYNGILQIESETTVLEFCNTYLGKPLNSANSEITKLTNALSKSSKAVSQWKDTAEKLDKDVWQSEKDRLLDGFLKLWNGYKSKAQGEIQQLKDELEKSKKSASASKAKKRQLAFDNNDAPDDLDNLVEDDELPIPMDVAEQYAKGGGRGRGGKGSSKNNANTTKKRREPILKPNDTFSTSDLKRGQEEKKRKDAIAKQRREEAKAAKAAEAAAVAEAQEQQDEESDNKSSSPESKENTRPAKIARKNSRNNKTQHQQRRDSLPGPESDEDSDDFRLRMAIHANVKKAKDNGDNDGLSSDSDMSY